MSKMRWPGLLSGLLLLTSSGCCWWADKWCPQSHYAQPAYAAPACCQPCVPYTPCAPVAQPGPAGYPAWTPPPRPAAAPGCSCP
jgi:hypothetical protein